MHPYILQGYEKIETYCLNGIIITLALVIFLADKILDSALKLKGTVTAQVYHPLFVWLTVLFRDMPRNEGTRGYTMTGITKCPHL